MAETWVAGRWEFGSGVVVVAVESDGVDDVTGIKITNTTGRPVHIEFHEASVVGTKTGKKWGGEFKHKKDGPHTQTTGVDKSRLHPKPTGKRGYRSNIRARVPA